MLLVLKLAELNYDLVLFRVVNFHLGGNTTRKTTNISHEKQPVKE